MGGEGGGLGAGAGMALYPEEGGRWTSGPGCIPQGTRDPSKSGAFQLLTFSMPTGRAITPPSQGCEVLSRDLQTLSL